jgi:hypothetical protein
MRLKPVTSRGLAGVGYQATTRRLAVEFRRGCIYQYRDVGVLGA